MEYPVSFQRDDNGTVLVTFPDFPEAQTFGDDRDEALARAQDALATVLDAYIKDRRPIPMPSEIDGAKVVRVPALTEVKVRLYETMRHDKVGKAELARRLHWHLPQIDRLVDVHHGSRLDQLEEAFSALGKRLTVCVEDITSHLRPKKPPARATRTRRRRSAQ
jgi:antitoxin HicB